MGLEARTMSISPVLVSPMMRKRIGAKLTVFWRILHVKGV